MSDEPDQPRPEKWVSNPILRAETERILALTIDERLREIEADANRLPAAQAAAEDSDV